MWASRSYCERPRRDPVLRDRRKEYLEHWWARSWLAVAAMAECFVLFLPPLFARLARPLVLVDAEPPLAVAAEPLAPLVAADAAPLDATVLVAVAAEAAADGVAPAEVAVAVDGVKRI